MRYCTQCGTAVQDDALYCTNCGNRLEPLIDDFPEEDLLLDAEGSGTRQENIPLSESVMKFMDGAADVADKVGRGVSTAVKNQKARSEAAVQREIEKAQKKDPDEMGISESGEEYMSATELWSELAKNSKRQHFFTEEVNTLTQEEYLRLLERKLIENRVPAGIETREVEWDRSGLKQRIAEVKPRIEAVNPLSCLIQFRHVGKFTYVEEKTFITPPKLPEEPERPVNIPQTTVMNATFMSLFGLILLLAGLGLFSLRLTGMGGAAILFGIILLAVGIESVYKSSELRKHNKKCEEQAKAWNQAWNNWENSILLHSFQESINGQVSRIYDAVFECIKQLNDELFAGKESPEEQESQSLNEMQELIARKKGDYR